MLTEPPSLSEEHHEIMESLNHFSEYKDETGKAIRELLDVLQPHFKKEETLVMPVLGSIPELVSGDKVTNLKEIAESQGGILQEYGQMFEEHSIVRRFILSAQKTASKEGHEEVVELLEGLAHHARVEEEVLYPAALLAGTVAKCLLPLASAKDVPGIA